MENLNGKIVGGHDPLDRRVFRLMTERELPVFLGRARALQNLKTSFVDTALGMPGSVQCHSISSSKSGRRTSSVGCECAAGGQIGSGKVSF
jgi:hypothetical protein